MVTITIIELKSKYIKTDSTILLYIISNNISHNYYIF